jgi:hypothetical protein
MAHHHGMLWAKANFALWHSNSRGLVDHRQLHDYRLAATCIMHGVGCVHERILQLLQCGCMAAGCQPGEPGSESCCACNNQSTA